MSYFKKSLGQNFLFDKNIIKKIINLANIKQKNVIEIGPGNGALTNEIIKNEPKSLVVIEKDNALAKNLMNKYFDNTNFKVINNDILKLDLEKLSLKQSIIIGNLPYNISSQILVKILNFNKWPPNFSDLIFMFQRELGEKIIGSYPSLNYGRLSILTNYRLKVLKKFFVSSNCFFPKPKVESMVIHFKPKTQKKFKIKIKNLEKITNIFFSNKRKMINKNIKKILSYDQISKIKKINLNSRPSELSPNMYYKITELSERS